MATTEPKTKKVSIHDFEWHAYLSRLTSLEWAAKRSSDGQIIATDPNRFEAAAKAKDLGYIFKY